MQGPRLRAKLRTREILTGEPAAFFDSAAPTHWFAWENAPTVGPLAPEELRFLFNQLQGGHFISAGQGQTILGYAKQWLGDIYAWGGDSETSGADCSHSTCSIYGQAGDGYPYQTSSQFAAYAAENGTPFAEVTSGPPQVGDVLLFAGHMAIYAGNGMMYTTEGSQTQSGNYSLAPVKTWGEPVIGDYRYQLPGGGN